MFPKSFICLAALLTLSACGVSSKVSAETSAPVVGRSAAPVALPPSIMAFEVCYPLNALADLQAVIGKVNEGLLSKQDLAEPLSSVSMASDIAGMMLKDIKNYEEYPDLEAILPKSELPNYLQTMQTEKVWFARARVKLLDASVIDLNGLQGDMQDYKTYLTQFCADSSK